MDDTGQAQAGVSHVALIYLANSVKNHEHQKQMHRHNRIDERTHTYTKRTHILPINKASLKYKGFLYFKIIFTREEFPAGLWRPDQPPDMWRLEPREVPDIVPPVVFKSKHL